MVWGEAYGENFASEYDGLFDILRKQYPNGITRRQLAEEWMNAYGEDMVQDYSGFWEWLPEKTMSPNAEMRMLQDRQSRYDQAKLTFVEQWVRDSVGAGPAIIPGEQGWAWNPEDEVLRLYLEPGDPEECDCITTDMSGRCVSCLAGGFEEYKFEDLFESDEARIQWETQAMIGRLPPKKIRFTDNNMNYTLTDIQAADIFNPELEYQLDEMMNADEMRMEPDTVLNIPVRSLFDLEGDVYDQFRYNRRKFNYALPPGTSNNLLGIRSERRINGKRFISQFVGFPSQAQAQQHAAAFRASLGVNVRTIKVAGGWRNYIAPGKNQTWFDLRYGQKADNFTKTRQAAEAAEVVRRLQTTPAGRKFLMSDAWKKWQHGGSPT